ncbi:hypothetical protein D7D52_22140 [Nocardia yunnanensis]|uniref:Uncharacterized protein n=1 Tax=Nocardia yunnanensis TaxID=2382165 RepID=A0A386ZEN4_9NOCA|nr:hypothetical protein [Nocardia yunnanensis]AYF76091.1 hypothetical protein D7D52_22140 [Nocardia yunnanensis]
MTEGTVKFRLIGDRPDITAMINALDPVLDIVQEWRIYPMQNGTGVRAYLEARPQPTDATVDVASHPEEHE